MGGDENEEDLKMGLDYMYMYMHNTIDI